MILPDGGQTSRPRGATQQGLPETPAGPFHKLWHALVRPTQRLKVRRYDIAPARWTTARMRIVMVSDLHICDPWVPLSRLDEVIERARSLTPDLVLFPGDLSQCPNYVTSVDLPLDEIATRLARLTAPLGRYAVLGNHDWWHDAAAQKRRAGPVGAAQALEAAGIPVLSNAAVELPNGVWLAGLESQEALRRARDDIEGLDDLPATLAQVPQEADTILLAHEPNVFADVPDRVALTLSGHTHGGQIRFFGWAPILPREIDRRFLHGHIRDGDRHLVISDGIGYSKLPLRIGALPEITVVEIGPAG